MTVTTAATTGTTIITVPAQIHKYKVESVLVVSPFWNATSSIVTHI